jgi:DNA polymerase-4
MDAFYASVELRDRRDLTGQPVVVGGLSARSVVLSATYEARAFGVRSAMPVSRARRLCPQAVFIPPRHGLYGEVSKEVMAIFRAITPDVEPLSLDEAFLDVTSSRALFGDGESIARAIKSDVLRELQLTASAGVAPCKFAAKVASDLGKPDGMVVVAPGEVAAFLAPLPVERMWGVGPKTAPRMRALGYSTIGDLARAGEASLERVLGSWGVVVAALACGADDRDVVPDGCARSIGAEETYDEDLVDEEAIARTLLDHAGRVARRLVRSGLGARTVAVKIKYDDFTLRTRRTTLPAPVQDTDTIHLTALQLLARVPLLGRRVRLTGVSVSGIVPGGPETTLFPDVQAEKRRKLEEVAAQIAERFGDETAVMRASLVGKTR